MRDDGETKSILREESILCGEAADTKLWAGEWCVWATGWARWRIIKESNEVIGPSKPSQGLWKDILKHLL